MLGLASPAVELPPYFTRPANKLLFGLVALSALSANAQVTAFTELAKTIKAPGAVAKLGPDLFGDKVNLYNGGLSFEQTDVSLPGMSKLAVSVGRRISTGQSSFGRNDRPFGVWDLDIPYMYGVFASTKGWTNASNTTARCSNYGAPPPYLYQTYTFATKDYWDGNRMHIPGQGDQLILIRNSTNTMTPAPNSSYPLVTSQSWAISCLPTLANGSGSGEGFLAIAPDGTRYRFDHMASVTLPTLYGGSTGGGAAFAASSNMDVTAAKAQRSGLLGSVENPIPEAAGEGFMNRKEVRMLPTVITDRYGNSVNFTYDLIRRGNLTKITASDGRSLTFTYGNSSYPYLITSVTDGTRTWTYSYSGIDMNLDTVTQPDGSAWSLSGINNLMADIQYISSASCDLPAEYYDETRTGSITHPSGATATFTMKTTTHGRSKVYLQCMTSNDGGQWARVPRHFYTFSLIGKSLGGPGLPSTNWSYDYGPPNASWNTCTSNCPSTKTVTVTDPSSFVTRYTFGNAYQSTDGKLLKEEAGWNGSSALRTTTKRYRATNAGPYPEYLGSSNAASIGDSDLAERPSPLDQQIINQQGVDFTWQANSFDIYRRPLSVTKTSSLGSRTETTVYSDNPTKWVLSQVAIVTEDSTGKVMVSNTYDPTTANLLTTSNFGQLKETRSYNTNGTILSTQDGLNQTTTYSNYKLGIPQLISYADGTTQSAVVNNIGKITSLTNEAGTTTALGYDTMGRLASISYPQEPGLAYNPTTVTIAQVGSWEYDLAPGHWRQVVATGNAVEANYYDALWRPIYTERWDSTDATGTIRLVKHQYDFAGNITYESYPKSAGLDVASEGTYSEYDALGRPTATTRISELGNLTESFSYNYGFQKTHTNAKGSSTVYSYQAFDDPADAAITAISMPEGARIDIARDEFGKARAITRSGNGLSATRSYVYDGYERLCKTIEPETGATIQSYDAANNIAWRASGLALTSASACNTGDVPASKQIAHTYDARNRLRNTTYGDGSPAIYRTYTNDGLPNTIQSDGTLWSYGYNNRRLLTSETLNYGGVNYPLGRSYNAHGALSQLTYPGGFAVDYNPNALGEARQAGSYASGVSYHANGAVKQFSYGNGILHTLSQNARGLPQLSQDGNVLKDSYAYDQNGNVTAITDQAEGITTRAMEYDGLDRLKRVHAPALWGDAWYGYDTLDNLISSQVTGGAKARSLAHHINYATNRLDSISGSYSLGYQYDSQGNIIQRGGQSYTFDIGNRMRGAPGMTTHVYDGLGRRVSVVGNDGLNHIYLYGQEGRLLYETTTGQPLSSGTKYIYLNRHVVAEVGASGVVYDHTDGLGSTVAKTNASAAVISRTRYEPYGATAAGAEPTLGFTGHLNAANLGLIDMQQRFYDPVAGRFLSIDPVLTDVNTATSFNRYNYANNSPYKYIDPDGRWAVHAAAFVIGAGIDLYAQAWGPGGKGFGGTKFDFKSATFAGMGTAVTGGVAGKMAIQATKGMISASRAIATTSLTGAAAGAAGSFAGSVANGETPNAAKVAVSAVGGGVGALVGAKIDNAGSAVVNALSSSRGVGSHVGATTQSATNFGPGAMLGTSTGQEAGKAAADISSTFATKALEAKVSADPGAR